MGVFCERLKVGSTATLDFRTNQNKGRYREKELLLVLVLLFQNFKDYLSDQANSVIIHKESVPTIMFLGQHQTDTVAIFFFGLNNFRF